MRYPWFRMQANYLSLHLDILIRAYPHPSSVFNENVYMVISRHLLKAVLKIKTATKSCILFAWDFTKSYRFFRIYMEKPGYTVCANSPLMDTFRCQDWLVPFMQFTSIYRESLELVWLLAQGLKQIEQNSPFSPM